MTQLSLFSDAPAPTHIARRTDPATSHIAAQSTDRQGLRRLAEEAARDLLKTQPNVTANEVAAHAVSRFGGITESYRKRVGESELLVKDCDRNCSITGKPCQAFRLSSTQSEN